MNVNPGARTFFFLSAAIALLVPFGSPADAACLTSQHVGHLLGGFYENCMDATPLSGFAYAVNYPDAINSNGLDLVCEEQGGYTLPGAPCGIESRIAGDGRVAILFDWATYAGGYGPLGCPAGYGAVDGDGRIAVIVAGENGNSLITSVGYSASLVGAYAVDAAHPYDGASVHPLSCSAASSTIRIDQLTSSGGVVNADVTVLVPTIHSDCDPGVAGAVLGTCPGGAATLPAVTRGKVYAMTGLCSESGGTVDLRRGQWNLVATPDATGHASVTLAEPVDPECLYIGATLTMGGTESPAIAGFVRHPPPACNDADFDGVEDCLGDCDDGDPEVHAGHAEVCDGIDNNCDGQIDENGVCDLACNVSSKLGGDMPVSTGPQQSTFPAIVWNGTGYGIAWVDDRDPDNAIYFARLDAAGSSIGGEIRVSSGVVTWSPPEIVWDGSGYGVLWMGSESGSSTINFRRLDSQGAPLGAQVPVSGASGGIEPSMVWTGSEYGVAWVEPRGQYRITFSRLDGAGSKIGTDTQVTLNSGFDPDRQPSLAWTGSGFGVAWAHGVANNWLIQFRRLDAAGNRIGSTADITFFSSSHCCDVPEPALAWAGSEYGLAWNFLQVGDRNTYFSRISAAGTKLGPNVLVTTDPDVPIWLDMVWTGAEYGLAWNSTRDGNQEIYLAILDLAGSKSGSDLRVTNESGANLAPTIAWHGSVFGLSFGVSGNQGPDIFMARVGCDCVDADGDGISSCDECDDTNAAVYPGSLESCDGLDNDCDGLMDEGLGMATCGTGACAVQAGICFLGIEQACFPALPTAEICDGIDNDCDGVLPAFDLDGDGDAFIACTECDDSDADIYPDAPEMNDGQDNQCPGDAGFGLIDETSGNSGFHNPADSEEYSWTPQENASRYELLRSVLPDFSADCIRITLSQEIWIDPEMPALGAAYFYLNRPFRPNAGSWGQNSSGVERAGLCP